jgi:fucose 4-O-acetylase-like acetyltransferase
MKERLVYLDNIKVILISYVITVHIAAGYGGIGGGRWSYIEPGSNFATKMILSFYGLFAYAFLMSMFIFIAGYFTYPSLKRKGTFQFLKDRMIRLSIPLLLYYFILGPIVRYLGKLAKGYDGSLFQFITESYKAGVYGFLGVMWFVAFILFFSVIYAFYLHLFPNGWYKPKDDYFPGTFRIFLFIIIIGGASFIIRTIFPMGGDFIASRPLGSLVFFGTSFFLGTTTAKYNWLEKLSPTIAMPWIVLALAVMIIPAILLVILRIEPDPQTITKPNSIISLLYAYWEVIKSIGTGMLAIVVFRKWFNMPGKFSQAMSQSVFLAYFIHPLVCMLLLYAFSFSGMHHLLKFAIVAPLALCCTFSIAWLLRRIPAVRNII